MPGGILKARGKANTEGTLAAMGLGRRGAERKEASVLLLFVIYHCKMCITSFCS